MGKLTDLAYTVLFSVVGTALYTKQIASIGPRTRSVEKIRQLSEHGADIMRINLAHAEITETVSLFNELKNLRADIEYDIYADMRGEALRLGPLDRDHFLTNNTVITIYQNNLNKSNIVFDYPDIRSRLKIGDKFYIDYGRVQGYVSSLYTNGSFDVHIVREGLIHGRDTIHIPRLLHTDDIDMISPTNLIDLSSIRLLNDITSIDYVVVPVDQGVDDIHRVKRLLEDIDTRILAKIGKAISLRDINSILDVCDGIVISRNELGVHIGIEKVPFIQSGLIAMANAKSKLSILSGQNFPSMIDHEIPSHAEISSITNAIMQNVSAILLSAETAIGTNPLECVSFSRRLIKEAESSRRQIFEATSGQDVNTRNE